MVRSAIVVTGAFLALATCPISLAQQPKGTSSGKCHCICDAGSGAGAAEAVYDSLGLACSSFEGKVCNFEHNNRIVTGRLDGCTPVAGSIGAGRVQRFGVDPGETLDSGDQGGFGSSRRVPPRARMWEQTE